MQIFYRLNSSADLSDLEESYCHSNANGIYFDLSKLYFDIGDRIKYNNTMKTVGAIQRLGKNILLTFNYLNLLHRPAYLSPIYMEKIYEYVTNNKNFENNVNLQDYYDILKNNDNKISQLTEMIKNNEYLNFYKEIIEKSQKFSNFFNQKDTLDYFSDNRSKILGLEIPKIVRFPEKEMDDPYFRNIQSKIEFLNLKFVELAREEKRFEMIYPVNLMLSDLIEESDNFKDQMKDIELFDKIMIWIIDSNELYQSKSKKNKFFLYLQQLSENYHSQIYVKFYGVRQFHEFKDRIDKVNVIFREDGYSGYNVNIPLIKKPFNTRRFFDINTLKSMNQKDIDSIDKKKDFPCNCCICTQYGVQNYIDVNGLFFSKEIINNADFLHVLSPKRKVKDVNKYLEKSSHELQSRLRKIHNFETADRIIFMNNKDFLQNYPSIVSSWNLENNVSENDYIEFIEDGEYREIDLK